MKTIILTIDGGGIKGIIPAFFLQIIEKRVERSCYEIFDIIGGTSTGGIIAAALTSPSDTNISIPFTASQILNIYKNNGDKIFVPQSEYRLVAEYYASDGSGNGVEEYLKTIFKNNTLNDNKQFIAGLKGRTKQVFTTTYVVNSSGGKVDNPQLGKDYGSFLFNWVDAGMFQNLNYYTWEAVRATSAAPVYFPVAHVGGGENGRSAALEKWALDGGVMSNNPALWAITEAFKIGCVQDLSDMILISIGTGDYVANNGVGITNEGDTVPADGNWGELTWMGRELYNLSEKTFDRGVVMDMILDASQMITNQQIKAFEAAGLKYFRLEPQLTDNESAMDNISEQNINDLQQTAQNYVRSNPQLFDELVNVLKSNLQ